MKIFIAMILFTRWKRHKGESIRQFRTEVSDVEFVTNDGENGEHERMDNSWELLSFSKYRFLRVESANAIFVIVEQIKFNVIIGFSLVSLRFYDNRKWIHHFSANRKKVCKRTSCPFISRQFLPEDLLKIVVVNLRDGPCRRKMPYFDGSREPTKDERPINRKGAQKGEWQRWSRRQSAYGTRKRFFPCRRVNGMETKV